VSSSFCLEDVDFDDDVEELEVSPDVEQKMLLLATCFLGEVRDIARNYMVSFFKRKNFSEGGRIPAPVLLSGTNVSMVINYDITESVDQAYKSLEGFSNNENFNDVEFVVSILNELSDSGIPQQFAGGMLLLYLKLVEGLEIV